MKCPSWNSFTVFFHILLLHGVLDILFWFITQTQHYDSKNWFCLSLDSVEPGRRTGEREKEVENKKKRRTYKKKNNNNNVKHRPAIIQLGNCFSF